MARIAGVTLPSEKRVGFSLTSIYGIGRSQSNSILKKTQIDPHIKVKELNEQQVNILRDYIEKNLRVEGELRREILMNIKRLKEIGTYRGVRHAKRLPVRGQRTRTNTRTVRGNVRRTMGSGKKPPAQKT